MDNLEFSIRHYPLMKDSGIDWIGEIPVDWGVKKLKYVANLKSGDNLTSNQIKEDGVYPVYGGNGLRGYYHEFTHEGDFILIGRQGALCGNIKYPANKFWATDHAVVVEPLSNYKLVWLGEVLRIMNLNQYSVAAAQPGLSVEAICNLFIPWPLLEEQTSIANFLDRKTAEIDALIAQKERLLELYEEEKTAIINHAVTKGLDPDVELKDSGVDWLGKIPTGWRLIKLRYLSNINTGEKDTENRQDDGQYPFYVRSQTIERISTYSYDGEAILTAGDGVGVGKVFHYVNGKFDYHQRVYKVSDFEGVIGKYLFYYMQINFHKEVIRISAKSTVDSLRLPMFQNFPVCFPHQKDEQVAIVQHIEAETARIDAKIAKTQRIIELQKEYRTALISEAVTGKIKVLDLPIQQAPARANLC